MRKTQPTNIKSYKSQYMTEKNIVLIDKELYAALAWIKKIIC